MTFLGMITFPDSSTAGPFAVPWCATVGVRRAGRGSKMQRASLCPGPELNSWRWRLTNFQSWRRLRDFVLVRETLRWYWSGWPDRKRRSMSRAGSYQFQKGKTKKGVGVNLTTNCGGSNRAQSSGRPGVPLEAILWHTACTGARRLMMRLTRSLWKRR